MKQYLVIDAGTMLPLGMYKSQAPNMSAMICSQSVVHVECPEDFSMDLYDVVKEGDVLKLQKK
jgi:hypothetical protein